MLLLEPPYQIIEGVSVFRDHADPLQYYYLPTAPHITRRPDPEHDADIPQFQVLEYRGEDVGGGGFLSLDVNVGVDEARLEQIRTRIRRDHDLDEPPRLAPVPVQDGQARLMLFGAREDEGHVPEDADEEVDRSQFVVRVDTHTRPSLYGDNRAIFSAELTSEGVVALKDAMQGEITPIGVVYDLEYWALRPAYHVHVHADWERVQHYIHEHEGFDGVFVQTQVDDIVDELIENRTITIEVDTFVPEDEAGSVLGRRDRAVNEVRDMVTEAFFEPSLDPIGMPEEDGWDRFTGSVERMVAVGVTGGLAALGTYTKREVDYKRIDKKRLDVNMSERTTVRRRIAPQAFLGGLFRLLRAEGLELDRFFRRVDVDDPWFDERVVTVRPGVDFEADGIESLHVRLTYGTETKDVELTASTDEKEVKWSSIVEDGQMRQEVTEQYTVRFADVDGIERPPFIESEPQVFHTRHRTVDPRALYSVVDVPIEAFGFPWEEYPRVEVHLQYEDAENGIRMQDQFLLDEGAPEATWKLFVRDPERRSYQYRLVYRAADHEDEVTPWAVQTDQSLTVRDPHPKKRTVMVVASFNWDDVNRVFVDVSYEDEGNDVHESESFEFSKDDTAPKTFSVALQDPSHRMVHYRTTILYNDGRFRESATSMTLDNRIIVSERTGGHRIVEVRPGLRDFRAARLEEMLVELRYHNEDAGLSFSDTYTFTSGDDSAVFEYDFAGATDDAFEYRVRHRFTNGMTREEDWRSADTPELVLAVE